VTDSAAIFVFSQSLSSFSLSLMSYRFRPVLTHFGARGTTLSYFLGSSRTEETDSLDRLCQRAQVISRGIVLKARRIVRVPGQLRGAQTRSRYGVIFSAICTAWIIAASITLSGSFVRFAAIART
jgi:hypothetical protein